MDSVKLSSRYRIVIPREVRESLNIRPGQAMEVFAVDGRIEVVPVRTVRALRGRCQGIDTHVERDEDRL